MNEAIEQDFNKSGLAKNMLTVEDQISNQVNELGELKQNLLFTVLRNKSKLDIKL